MVYKNVILLLMFFLQGAYGRTIYNEPDNAASGLPGCEVKITGGLGEPQPLFVIPDTNEFLLPSDSSGFLRLESGQTVELICAGSQFNKTRLPWWWWLSHIEGPNSIMATCIEGVRFDMPWGKANISTARCVSYPYHEAIPRIGSHCGAPERRGTEIIDIGFRVSQNRFIQLFDVCHDSDVSATLYSHHQLGPASKGFQNGVARTRFAQGNFYDFSVNNAYIRKNQKQTFADILDSMELAASKIHEDDDYFLARGHLAAKADFVFGAQQRATFYYLNAAPQWQTFNGGNWLQVEVAVRDFASARGIKVDAYTGTHGVMTLPDEQGVQKEIYLHFDENNNPQLPVPRVYYRIIHEPATGLGVVIVGVNNPYASEEEIKKDYIYCTNDIIDKLDWLKLDPKDLKKGYTYACELQEFLKVVDDAPELVVNGLLY